jgi:HAE1 family hydrophobic/amphiphilic exporter-1
LKRIIQFAIHNKFAIWLLTIMVVIGGLYAGTNMKLETLPNINAPVVTITTTYPGASPQEIADEISDPIEQSIQNVAGVKTVTSTSAANISSIQVEYEDYNQDMDQAVEELRNVVDKVQLPENVEKPEISKVNINDFPILALSVSAENKSMEKLTQAVEEGLIPKLEGISGVYSIDIAGHQEQEVQLKWKEDQLNKYGLTPQTLQQTLQSSDVSRPLGLYTIDQKLKSIVLDGKANKLEDLKKLKIPVTSNSPAAAMNRQTPVVELQELADIQVIKSTKSISHTDGKESIGVQVIKTNDANTVDVVNAIKKEIQTFQENNDGYHITTTFDQGKPIQDSVNTMLQKAFLGALFAVIIILLFLRDIRSTIISVFSIPLSILIALLVLDQLNITLNVMTLGAMTVAIGRVVDDSIVVIENIYRRLNSPDEPLRGTQLIQEATQQMFVPILSSTIVTIAVFLPLGMVDGPVGELFYAFALTIVCALLASLLVAITIVPMLGHSFFRKRLESKAPYANNQIKKPSRVAHYYKRVLQWSLNHKVLTFSLAILLLIGSLLLIPKIGVSFLPTEEEKTLTVTYNPVPGDTIEDVKSLAKKTEAYFDRDRDIESIQYTVGGENPLNPTAKNQMLFIVKYREDTSDFKRKKDEVLRDLRAIATKGDWAFQDVHGAAGNNKLTLYVYGDHMNEIQSTVSKIVKEMKNDDGLTDVDSSLSEAYDQFTLSVDHAKLSQYGLTVDQVAQYLSISGDPAPLTQVQHNGQELDVRVATNQDTYKNINELLNKKITTPIGTQIALKEVVKVHNDKAPHTVTKRNDDLYADISATVKEKDVSKATTDLKKKIDDLDLPSGINVEFGGVAQQINDSFSQLGLAMLAAIGIVYFILVLTFGEALAPFVILFSLPFTIIGGLVGLLVAGETISVSALIGALMLIGIVVTNAIVLIDRVIRKEKEGLSTREALIEAGMTRIRPILMTAIATVGALIPLALGMENGGLISRGLGVTVIGGLTSSTLLTLVIVPIVYETLMRKRSRKKKENEVATNG